MSPAFDLVVIGSGPAGQAAALEGAMAGTYKVIIVGQQKEDQSALTVELPTPYTVEPRENRYTIEIVPPRQ